MYRAEWEAAYRAGEITQQQYDDAFYGRNGLSFNARLPSVLARTAQEAGNLPDVYSRWLQGRGGYNTAVGYAQNEMEKGGDPAIAQYQLQGALQPAGQQATFESFLGGGRPAVSTLQQQLNSLTNYLKQPLGTTGLGSTEDIMRAMFGSQTEQGRGRQFQASIQPKLAQLAPFFKSFFERGSAERANRFMAAKPEVDWLTEAQRLGYFQ